MAISILQTATATFASGSSTVGVTITVTAGSVLHVYGTWSFQNASPDIGNTQGGVADNKNGTYCPICRVDNGTLVAKHWYVENAAAGSTTITLTCNDIASNLAIYVEEIGGLPTTGTLVGRSYNSQASPGTGTDAVTSGTATLVAGSQIICAASINAAIGTAPTAGTGFTTDGTNPTWLAAHARQESLVTSAGGNTAATFTAVTGTNAHLTLMAVFGTAVNSGTGGYISNDGTNVIHTFVTTGTFTPSQSLTIDSLVVAGGGGGGSDPAGGQGGGGGGGGGVLYTTGSAVTAQAYTITVGTGGTDTVTDGGHGNNGGNSSISILSLTAIGGGGGANTKSAGANNGAAGGSGGGASALGSVSATGGTATGGQGNAGGNCTPGGAVTNPGGGGGGGAGAAGATNTTADDVGGYGGDGVSNSITSCATYYGGGGAGAGDLIGVAGDDYGGKGGGGSANGTGGVGNNAESNTGGGGGGTGADGVTTAGHGATGIVIIRYPISGGGGGTASTSVDVTGTFTNVVDGNILIGSVFEQLIEIDICISGVWNKLTR